MKNFLILGLPRSRTHWLSNFLTYAGSFCHHELLGYVSNIEAYKKKMKSGDYEFIGDADTAGLFIEEEFDCPKVIIHRPVSDVLSSLRRLFPFNDLMLESLVAMENKLHAIDGLHIDFDGIDHSLRDIWDYCIDAPYDESRGKLLSNMLIDNKTLPMFENITFLKKLSKEVELCH